jgi:hypothetical protein
VGDEAESLLLEADRCLSDPVSMERVMRLIEDDPVGPAGALAEDAGEIQSRLDA